MAYISIKDLTEGPINQVFLVREIYEGIAKTGDKKFTSFSLIDKTGEIKCTFWASGLRYASGKFVKITGRIDTYKEDLRILGDNIEAAPTPQNIEDYVWSLDGLTISNYLAELNGHINEIQDEFYRNVTKQIVDMLSDTTSEFDLKTAPLTDERYGSYRGALLEHIVYSLRHAIDIQHNYCDRNCPINPDLLKSIIILHDVGRVVGLCNIFAVQKTVYGKLLGLNEISQNIVSRKCSELVDEDYYDAMKGAKLLHGVIVSSSNQTPLFIEALIAQQVQKLDVLVTIYSKQINGAKSNQEFTFGNQILGTELLNG